MYHVMNGMVVKAAASLKQIHFAIARYPVQPSVLAYSFIV